MGIEDKKDTAQRPTASSLTNFIVVYTLCNLANKCYSIVVVAALVLFVVAISFIKIKVTEITVSVGEK
jgi:hypothetical protein